MKTQTLRVGSVISLPDDVLVDQLGHHAGDARVGWIVFVSVLEDHGDLVDPTNPPARSSAVVPMSSAVHTDRGRGPAGMSRGRVRLELGPLLRGRVPGSRASATIGDGPTALRRAGVDDRSRHGSVQRTTTVPVSVALGRICPSAISPTDSRR
jgi:hypothetical protein